MTLHSISQYTDKKLSEDEEIEKRRMEREQQKISRYKRDKGRNLDSFESALSDEQISTLTPQRIANAIMLRSKPNKTFFIVEGKSDYKIFNKFIKKGICNIEIAFGNEKVIEVIEELKLRKFGNALGLIDSDFRVLDEDLIDDENIIHTEFHDVEIMLINSDCFETVLSNQIQEEKFKKSYNADYNIFREHLFELTKHLGYLKWLNKRKHLGLIFKPSNPDGKSMEYANFICTKDLIFFGL